MKKLSIFFGVMVIFLSILFFKVLPVEAENHAQRLTINKTEKVSEKSIYIKDEILVKFKLQKGNSKISPNVVSNFTSSNSLTEVQNSLPSEFVLMKITDGKTPIEKVAEIKAKNDSNIEYVQPNFQYARSVLSQNDTSASSLWGLNNTG